MTLSSTVSWLNRRFKLKHLIHCVLMFIVIGFFQWLTYHGRDARVLSINPWKKYGILYSVLLHIIKLLIVLPLPYFIFHFFGLTLYDAFPEEVVCKHDITKAPMICFRVVTRGNYPALVKANVKRNMKICMQTKLKNYSIEVVTDSPIGLAQHKRLREIVIPIEYKTKTGAMFKARALQYCLEDSVNTLEDSSWIVHLDEETLLTKESVYGILDFVFDGKHAIGQGMITYANERVVNWFTTLADSARVGDDMGKLRMQFKTFHAPLYGIKGSFLVIQMRAEKKVSFDHGLVGSIAEDAFFALRAFSEGYTFDYIHGEMHEKSPFTILDFIRQHKRWFQGTMLIVHSNMIPLKCKILLRMCLYASIVAPLYWFKIFFPIPGFALMDYISGFISGVGIYMQLIGTVKSFNVQQYGYFKIFVYSMASALLLPFFAMVESVSVGWGLLDTKYKFHIVQKEITNLHMD